MDFQKTEYPKWIYSRAAAALVKNYDEHVSKGDGWYESPADVPKPVHVVVLKETTVQATTVPETVSTVADIATEKLKKFYESPSKLVTDQVKLLDSVEELEELQDLEGRRPGGVRAFVARAIKKQLDALKSVTA